MKGKLIGLTAFIALLGVHVAILADHNSNWGPGWRADTEQGSQGGDNRPFEDLTARLDPAPDIQGRGQATYKVFDDEQAAFEKVFIVNARLRLLKGNGSAANEVLGITEENAPDAVVTAYLSRETVAVDEFVGYAVCGLVFDGFILDEYEVAYYATYRLELKQDAGNIIEAIGLCVDASEIEMLPDVKEYDVIDIGVVTPAVTEEVRPVMMGAF